MFTKFVQATSDSIHSGVINSNGGPKNTLHNMLVGDNLFADTPSRMKQAQAASAESLYEIAGFSQAGLRRSPLSLDKYYAALCSYKKKRWVTSSIHVKCFLHFQMRNLLLCFKCRIIGIQSVRDIQSDKPSVLLACLNSSLVSVHGLVFSSCQLNIWFYLYYARTLILLRMAKAYVISSQIPL